MPPLPPVPNVLRLDMPWTMGSYGKALTRLHFSYSGSAPSAANLVTLATDIVSAGGPDLAPLILTGSGSSDLVLTDIASNTGAEGSSTNYISGSRSGSELPYSVATLVNYGIARRYRGGKPRSYFPLGAAADIGSSGSWTSGFLTAAQNGLNSFIAAIVGLSAASTTITGHVNVSYYSGFTVVTNPSTGRARNVPKLRSGGPVIDQVISLSVNGKPGSVRRRNAHSS